MGKEKPGFRTSLPPAEDDPFLNRAGGGVASFSADDADSIFSMSQLPDRPATVQEPASGRATQAPQNASTQQEEHQTPPDPHPQEAPQPPIRLEQYQDDVLNTLVEHEMLNPEQMALLGSALQSWKPGESAWRMALTVRGLPHEHIRAVAAHVHKIPFVDLRKTPRSMLVTTLMSLPDAFQQQCSRLKLLPFTCKIDEQAGEFVLELAASDPLSPEVAAFVGSIQTVTRLYYAPLAMLNEAVRGLAG